MADDDSTDDTESGPSYTEQLRQLAGVGGQPKTSTKKATSLPYAPVSPDRSPDEDTDTGPPTSTADIGGKDYRFTALSGALADQIEHYGAQNSGDSLPNVQGPVQGDPNSTINRDLEEALGGVQNAKDLSPKEYDALTKEASRGNTLAQQILVKGKFKATPFPTESQDLSKIEDPFVQALSGMPALAENAQNQMNAVQQPYDFTNATAQVNSLLGQMGSTQRMSSNAETTGYVNTLNNEVASAGNLNSSALGLPSIMSALGGLGPAAKESTKATPYASMLAALLGHEQYLIEYGGAAPGQTATDPAWLQQLIAQVTGSTSTGGLPAPSTAASGVVPSISTSATPTGSNG